MLLRAEESLERFGTIAFGIEVIRQCVTFDQVGRCCSKSWWKVMPVCYWADVLDLIIPIQTEHDGAILTAERIDRIHTDIAEAIEKGLMKRCPNLRSPEAG